MNQIIMTGIMLCLAALVIKEKRTLTKIRVNWCNMLIKHANALNLPLEDIFYLEDVIQSRQSYDDDRVEYIYQKIVEQYTKDL